MADIQRAYLQRPYGLRYGGYGGGQSAFERGMEIGNKFGGQLGELAQAIAGMRERQQMDAVANQLMNTQNAPRAALVSPGTAQYDPVSDMIGEEGLGDQFQTQTPGQPNVIPPGVSTTGTAPATGGYAEYQLRQKFQQDQLADQIKRAQLENYLAQLHGTGRYAPKPAGPAGPSAAQQAISERMAQSQAIKQAYADQKANSDSVAKVYQDFDKIHGKGSAAEVYTAIQAGTGYRGKIVHDPNGTQHWVGDPNGPLFTTDHRAATNPPIDKDFQYYNMDELNSYNQRLQTVQQQGIGGVYRPPLRAQPAGVVSPGAPVPAAAAATDTTGTDTTGTDTIGTDMTGTDMTGTDTSDLQGSTSKGGSSANLAQANLPQPMSLSDYNQIPTGALFVDGDGLTKRKYTS